jgi:hypothetical protein
MWERCGFDVFLPEGEDQENDQEEEEGQVQLIEESEYAAWKEDVAQVYSHEQLKDFQRAREDCIRRMVARLGVLMKDDA